MLRDEIERYTNLTGEDGWHVPIMKVGAYLDGYDKGTEVLDKIRDEIREQSRMHMDGDLYIKTSSCMQIINDYMAEEDKA